MPMEFDVVVIGGGPGGENAAAGVARGGMSIALIEGERVGGECTFWACMPSKALLRPPEVHDTARHTPGVRHAVTAGIDLPGVLAHRDRMRDGGDDRKQAEWVENAQVTLLRGHGELTGPRQIKLTTGGSTRQVSARRAVVLAVGSRPRFPDIPGLRDSHPWTNREATSARAAPRRLVILGGGPVAVEMAQAWSALGSEEVTLVEHGQQLVQRMEPFVRTAVEQGLRQAGVDVRLNTRARQVRRSGRDVTITLDSGATLVADELLVATGRRPATEALGLESVGLKPGEPIPVDDSLRVASVPGGWLYAIGDCNGRNLLTHMAKYQARILSDVLNDRETSAWADLNATPQVLFTQPQVASVGLTEEQARKKGSNVRTAQYALENTAGYSLYGPDWTGAAKLVVDGDRKILVGATLLGLGVGEMLHAATIAIAGQVPISRLWHAVPCFPTVSEVWLRLLEQLAEQERSET